MLVKINENLCRNTLSGFVLLLLFAAGCINPQKKHPQNRLQHAASPYLQEHADNPVDWYEWGEEALAKAKQENKPLLISIGYASCHWCHVMERETFMDTAVARVMNESFVCIKVDREERPDLDNIYMHACQLLNKGEAGWPLNAFALPDGKPFFAGTYYTKQTWLTLLNQISDSYKYKNSKVVLQANSLTYGIIDSDSLLFKNDLVVDGKTKESYATLVQTTLKQIDTLNGGIQGKQKFPTPSLWEFLLQAHYLTGDTKALETTENTLSKMALGGLYDHLGGGFARYSTDSVWRIPHFEKMLYDNAQLTSLYAHAYQLTGNEFYKSILTETIAFVERELTSSDGGFYSSLNAETDGDEGAFYAWSYDAFTKVTGAENAALFANYYHVSQQGNWEKKRNILFATERPASFAKANNLSVDDFNSRFNKTRQALFAERNKRKKPTVDDKILTSWNAIMLKAYLDAFTATGSENFLQKAITNAEFLEKNMLSKEGCLLRSYKSGKATINAFLDDYAWLSLAYLKLYQVTFNQHWLKQAKLITDYAVIHFYDPSSGMFYYTALNDEKLVVRKTDIQDHVIPSSNAVMATVLYSLATFYSDSSYFNKSNRMLSVISGKMQEQPAYYAQWGQLSGWVNFGTFEVAVMGNDALAKNRALQKKYLPVCLFMGATNEENLPILQDKLQVNKTMIYVCTNATCKLPVESVERALNQIKQIGP
jgi:uncharacterized protein YyaL (SSP411 family)